MGLRISKQFTKGFDRLLGKLVSGFNTAKKSSKAAIPVAKASKPLQPSRTQQYYDEMAKELHEGATYLNPRNGNVIHTYSKGLGDHGFNLSVYKGNPALTPGQTVKEGKQIFKLADDSYYGLYQFDRYLAHGEQEANYLSTWNAQRKFWSPQYGWQIRDGNPFVRFQTTFNENTPPFFGKCFER